MNDIKALDLSRTSDTKEEILNRLYERVGECMHCGKRGCNHGSNQRLPMNLKLDDVLWAINLDNYFDGE